MEKVIQSAFEFLCAWTKENRELAIKKDGKVNNLVAPPSDKKSRSLILHNFAG